MKTLDDYLTSQYLTDGQELARIERIIGDASATLCEAFVSNKGWPYRLKKGTENTREARPPAVLSQSTTAMVSLSLVKLLGVWKRPGGYPICPSFPPPKIQNKRRLENVARQASELLIKATAQSGGTGSKTYGENDPLTLSYLASFRAMQRAAGASAQWRAVEKYVKDQSRPFQNTKTARTYLTDHRLFFSDGTNPPEGEIVSNALIPLRVVQCLRDIKDGSEQDLSAFREYFETTLHDQLSFSSIPDSRFDPAELTFCLEGLLLSQGYVVDRSLFKRVIDVLASAQNESAFWRPTKPFMATEKGMSLFPVSVEVANSLLRACELFDGLELYDTFGSASLEMFRRYWQWLRARTVTFPFDNRKVLGWHSEHVNQSNVIHVWETSQVLEFLVGFHRLLQAHIARTTLIGARFDTKPARSKVSPAWKDIQANSEAVTSLGDNYKIYERIGKEFISGWLDGKTPKSYSMLLYGPPGTGKTHLASTVADALGFPLITITVSDFLEAGGAQVEARAKAIFGVLTAQSDCVVFFDEIDNFLLDRDTARYSHQETVFQFMTPGMLTKLNDLRRSERVIFAIGTNYENRIDPAIKRTGRIDRRYLVLPPDAKARRRIIFDDAFSAISKSDPILPKSPAQRLELVNKSVFLGARDIATAISQAHSRQEKCDTLIETLFNTPRTIRLAVFRNRLPDAKGQSIEEPGKYPLEEFFCLLALALEAKEETFLDKLAGLGAKRALGSYENVAELSGKIKQAALGLGDPSVRALAKYLNQLKD